MKEPEDNPTSLDSAIDERGPQPVRSALPRVLLTLLTLAALRLFLVAPFPFSFKYLTVDDQLYVDTAYHLSEGEWLGPYDGRNLLKEIGFPLFMAGSEMIGLPLRWAQELMWILACSTLFWLLRRLRFNWLGSTIGTAIVLFHPVAAPGNFDRILREHLYNSQLLGLLCLGLVIATMTRFRQRAPWLLVFAVLTVWTWHSREEGIWLAGILALQMATMLILDRQRQSTRRGLAAGLVLVVLVGSGLFGFRSYVTSMNERHYGAAVFLESKDVDFRAALGAMIRAETEDKHRFYPIRNETLAGLYEVSPALASIRSTLDSDSFRIGWMRGPDGARPTNAMGWALRSGAERAGHHTSLVAAKAFYRQLADEVNAHLDQDIARYGPIRVSVFPPMRWHWWRELADETRAAIEDCYRLDLRWVGDVPTPASVEIDAVLAERSRRVVGQEELPARIAHSERRNVLTAVLRLYRQYLPWLVTLGLGGILVHVIRRRRHGAILLAFLVLIATVAARALIVGALEIWFCPSRSTYLLCAMPLLAAASWIGLQAGLASLVPDRWTERLSVTLDRAIIWGPILLLLAVAGLVAGHSLAEKGRYLEVPLQLTSRVSPEEAMVMEVSFAERQPGDAGLKFVARDHHPSIFVTPWIIRKRTKPVDFKIRGRAETQGNQPVVFVCYGEGTGFQGEWRQNVTLDANGEFDLVIPLGAHRIRACYLGGPIPEGRHLELHEFKTVVRP